MSVQAALDFIRLTREDAPTRARVEALGPAVELPELVAIGRDAGLDFTPTELRAAHRQDWAFRRIRFGRPAEGGAT